MHTEECHVKLKVEIKEMLLPAQEHPKWQANQRNWRKSMEQTLPYSLRKARPCPHLDLRFLVSRTGRNQLLCVSHLAWGTLLQPSQEMNTGMVYILERLTKVFSFLSFLIFNFLLKINNSLTMNLTDWFATKSPDWCQHSS